METLHEREGMLFDLQHKNGLMKEQKKEYMLKFFSIKNFRSFYWLKNENESARF